MSSPKIGCLVMAAGSAARFRSNKLAAEFDGKSLIRRALEAVPAQNFAAVTVVTQYPEVAALAEEFGFTHIYNERPEDGLSRTIALGTEAMLTCDAIVYMVSDQPLLERASVERVVARWKENPSYIVGAAHHGKRGNPCIFPREFFGELLALEGDRGGSTLIRAHPDRLLTVEIGKAELADVDTPQDLEKMNCADGA